MHSDSSKFTELSKLLEEVKEYLVYLEELEVEELEMPFEGKFLKLQEEKREQVRQAESFQNIRSPAKEATSESLRFSESEQRENLPTNLFKKPSIFDETRLSSIREAFEKKSKNENTAAKSASQKDEDATEERTIEVLEMTKKKQESLTISLFDEIPSQALPVTGETLEDIRKDIGDCKRCPLHQNRTQIVHSIGNPKAELMFVGEAPGADEDIQGKPFVGKAGQLLTKIIEAMRFKREDVFIGNINRCRPPGNRAPTPEEALVCREFLIREICVVRPKVIVLLGNTACQNLLDKKVPVTKIRGEFQDFYGIKVMPTFHPAYLLRDPSKKREVWEDMKKVMDYLGKR